MEEVNDSGEHATMYADVWQQNRCRLRCISAILPLGALLLNSAAPHAVLALPAPADTVCTEIPGHVAFGGLDVVPPRPQVGDDVELRFAVQFEVYSAGP